MAGEPTLAAGGTTVTLKVSEPLSEITTSRVVRIGIPERAGDRLQLMGRNSKTLSLRGYIISTTDKNQLETWAEEQTLLVYNDNENTDINVRIFNNLTIKRRAGFPVNYYDYSFELVVDE